LVAATPQNDCGALNPASWLSKSDWPRGNRRSCFSLRDLALLLGRQPKQDASLAMLRPMRFASPSAAINARIFGLECEAWNIFPFRVALVYAVI
jgi:hypothetical protein